MKDVYKRAHRKMIVYLTSVEVLVDHKRVKVCDHTEELPPWDKDIIKCPCALLYVSFIQ